MMLASVATFAQQPVGTFSIQPKVGMTLGNITKIDGDTRVGVLAGVEGEYQVSDMLGIAVGVNYAQQGEKVNKDIDLSKFSLGKISNKNTFKLDYINVPIVANVYVAPGLAVKAGVQFGFNVNSKYNNSIVSGIMGRDVDMSDLTNSFDFSIPVGVSYEYQNFVLDARYNFGCTSVLKDDYKNLLEMFGSDYKDSKNSVFQITLGYKFAL